jgi:hypothetical protein
LWLVDFVSAQEHRFFESGKELLVRLRVRHRV